nr:DNA-directed DNA polymerase [Tanacetum cinerariifolium]
MEFLRGTTKKETNSSKELVKELIKNWLIKPWVTKLRFIRPRFLNYHSISRTVGVVEDVFVKVGTFHFPSTFVVVDFDADPRVPLILGRSFLKTGRALIDVYEGELTLRVGKKAITFNLDQTSRYSANYDAMSVNQIDFIDVACEEYYQEVLGFSVVEPTNERSSIDEPPVVELKDLPPHLEYAFLEGDDKLPIIIAKDLKDVEKITLIKVLKSHKQTLAWQLSDIKGIASKFCTHKILMEHDFKPTVQHQRRVNPKIHEVIKKEVLKLLDAGLIYPILDSPWVSPVHCVPKKGGFIVVENEENKLIPTRLVTGWRVCIDYQKLNGATRKDHFLLPFMDQMLERLARNKYYCFLDGFSEAKNGDEKPNGDTSSKTNKEPVDREDQIPSLEDIYEVPSDGIFTSTSYDDEGAVADFTNLESIVNIEPKKISQALKDKSWVDAMQEELLQFKTQNVWILVDLPFGKKIIGIKWVYMNKKDKRGVVVRTKARLVAQEHRQEEGIDYNKVFALMAKIEAIRIFLAFASYMGFIVYQMDGKSAFLYGKINEEVYVSYPLGLIDPKFLKKVYKVVKALYGLHQAPRAWYATLSTFLVKSRYRRGIIDKTLFIKKDKKDIMLEEQVPDEIYG